MVCVPDTTTAKTDNAGPAAARLSDERLIARIRKHDQEAFSCLLHRHLNAVHGYLFRLTGSRADADDLAQETFLRVWQKAATFKPGRVKLATWLHRIAHNLCIDEFRKQRKRADVVLEDIADTTADQATRHARSETLEHLNKELMALPEAQRCALALCPIQGFSNSQAADILGVSVSALESLLARGRRQLKKKLSEHTT